MDDLLRNEQVLLKEVGITQGGLKVDDDGSTRSIMFQALCRAGWLEWLATGCGNRHNWTTYTLTVWGWAWFNTNQAAEKLEQEWANVPAVSFDHPSEGLLTIKESGTGRIYLKRRDNSPMILTHEDDLYSWAAKLFDMQAKTEIKRLLREAADLMRVSGLEGWSQDVVDIIQAIRWSSIEKL